MNFFIMVSLFLSAALGVFRGIDLALLTDAETGLCIVGPVWLRYGALAVAVGAAVAAGRCCKPQAGALRGHCTPSGVVALAAAVCYGEAAVLRILWMHSSVVMLLRAVLEALCAFWMIGLGLSWLRKDWKIPTRSLTPAVLGSVIFYWCVLARFMENSSSWHRVAPTAMVWQLLAGLMFLSALAPGALPARHVGWAHPLRRRAGGVCPLPVLGAAHRAADPCTGGRRGSAVADAAVPAGAVLCGRFGSLERCALHKDCAGCINASAAAWLNCSKQHPITPRK
mgnify:CR=1 FL=1